MIISITDVTTQVNVDLQGPLYAKSGDTIWVNCSSNTVPAGESAEFLLDGETINSLRRHNNGCYSASTSKECTRDICQCSENGKTYGIRINMNQQKADVHVEIVCSMKFKTGRTFYLNDSIYIHVLGNNEFIYVWRSLLSTKLIFNSVGRFLSFFKVSSHML